MAVVGHRILASGGGLQGIVHLGPGQHAFGAGGIVAILKAVACRPGTMTRSYFPEAESLLRLLLIKDFGTNRRTPRRALQHAERLLRTGASDDGDRCDVSRLVAEGNAQAERQQQGKSKDPENDFGLALQFQQTRSQQMRVARPAADCEAA